MMEESLTRRPPLEPAPTERPIGEIVSNLWHDTEKLVRQEMQLGLAELDERVDRLKRELMIKAVGGILLLGGFLAIVASLILLLAKAIDPWLSALLVGVVLAGVGYAFEQRKLVQGESDSSFTHMKQGHSLKEALK